eukprot:PITA_21935
MDGKQESQLPTVRHKCAACFRQFNKVEHLVDHMRISFHSGHEPTCGVCKKHCRSFDSLREHLIGPLPKVECAEHFSKRGCKLCLNIFRSAQEAAYHQAACQLPPASLPAGGSVSLVNKRIQAENSRTSVSAVSLSCEMVGGGQDGSLDLCAKICLIDEEEKLIFYTYVKPQLTVTNYRYDISGIKAEHLKSAMPLKQVQETVRQILYNGEVIWRAQGKGGRARLLVGHNLDHVLQCLEMEYPAHLIRDTTKYPPLVKTNKASNSLNNLTQAFLGYEIQRGPAHEPYEDCVAAMRLYKKLRSQRHSCEEDSGKGSVHDNWTNNNNPFTVWKQTDLEAMTPDALLKLSRSDYYCWCLDAPQQP